MAFPHLARDTEEIPKMQERQIPGAILLSHNGLTRLPQDADLAD